MNTISTNSLSNCRLNCIFVYT